MTDTLLKLDNVGVSYFRGLLRKNRYWALKDVSFELFRGETLGVIGRNGAGKSTLLRLMSNIIEPDKGCFSNFSCTTSLLSLQLGFIPHLTGRENVQLSGLLMGKTKQQMLDCMDEIIEFSEVGDFIDQPVKIYSHGMRARLGFSVANKIDPDVLLIDEIIGVGDEAFRKKSTEIMKERIKSDHTVVLVSHSGQLIRELCDRVVWIENGSNHMVGKTSEVMNAYQAYLRKNNLAKKN